MTTERWRAALVGAGLGLVLASVACGPGGLKTPIHLQPDFQFVSVDRVVVLPPVDLRVDKSYKLDVAGELGGRTLDRLKHRGFAASVASSAGDAGDIAEEDLKDPKAEWVQKLGPSDARWVFVTCLVDLKTRMTFGSTGNAEVSGFLFDREHGTLAWRDKGFGQAGQGGLMGMAMKGSMKGSALNAAFDNLFASVPDIRRK
jgi:hypothetical protein